MRVRAETPWAGTSRRRHHRHQTVTSRRYRRPKAGSRRKYGHRGAVARAADRTMPRARRRARTARGTHPRSPCAVDLPLVARPHARTRVYKVMHAPIISFVIARRLLLFTSTAPICLRGRSTILTCVDFNFRTFWCHLLSTLYTQKSRTCSSS